MTTVKVVCSGCAGKGTTIGYPNQRPSEDPGEYTCWACKGEKSISGTLAPGELDRLVAERLAELAEHQESVAERDEHCPDGRGWLRLPGMDCFDERWGHFWLHPDTITDQLAALQPKATLEGTNG